MISDSTLRQIEFELDQGRNFRELTISNLDFIDLLQTAKLGLDIPADGLSSLLPTYNAVILDVLADNNIKEIGQTVKHLQALVKANLLPESFKMSFDDKINKIIETVDAFQKLEQKLSGIHEELEELIDDLQGVIK